MKLDWDLIREQLTCIEDESDVFVDAPKKPEWTTQTEAEFNQEIDVFRNIENRLLGHLEILTENSFIAGITISRPLDGGFSYGVHSPRLTLKGHELLATLRSKDLWERIKRTAKNKGIELTVSSIMMIGKVALYQLVGE